MVQPTASTEGAYWVVFDHEKGEKFYSSHDSFVDAEELASRKNAEERDHEAKDRAEVATGARQQSQVYQPLTYRVRPRP